MRTAWRGAIITAGVIAILTLVSETVPRADWARPPESIALVIFLFLPQIVFWALAQRDED